MLHTGLDNNKMKYLATEALREEKEIKVQQSIFALMEEKINLFFKR